MSLVAELLKARIKVRLESMRKCIGYADRMRENAER
jgi:hypothetical protein